MATQATKRVEKNRHLKRVWPPDPDSFDTEKILLDVVDSMCAAAGTKSALNRLASLALLAAGADRSAIFIPGSDGTELLPAAAASKDGDSKEMWEKFRAMEPIDISTDAERAAVWQEFGKDPRTIALDSAEDSPLLPETWKRTWGSKSVAMAALRVDGEMLGLLAVDYYEQHHSFTAAEVRLLGAIAGAAAVALKVSKLVEKLHRGVETERRLVECTAALRSGISVNRILEVVAEGFVWLLPDASSSINLLSADGKAFRPVVSKGKYKVSSEIRLSELPAADVERISETWAEDSHTTVLIPEVRNLPGWEDRIPSEIQTAMLVPLSDGKNVLGFVAIGRNGSPFVPEEVGIASAFADHAAVAIARARLNDALDARVRVVETLLRLSDTVIGSSDLRSVLGELNASMGPQADFECLRASLENEALAALLRVPHLNDQEKSLVQSWKKNGAWAEAGNGSNLAIPVPIRGRVAGVLWVKPSKPKEHIDLIDLEFLRALGAGIGEVAYKAKLRKTAEGRAQELAVASERERIGRDLHDTVGQALYGIGLKLEEALKAVEEGELRSKLAGIRAEAAQGVADMRSAVYALSFLHVRGRGLVSSMKKLARQFELGTRIPVEVKVEGRIRVSEEIESALYRVVHEALVNVERHARASAVVISIGEDRDQVRLTIRDDGVGLDQRQGRDWRSAAHFGIKTMAKSVVEVGGRFDLRTAEPRGLVIEATTPTRAPG